MWVTVSLCLSLVIPRCASVFSVEPAFSPGCHVVGGFYLYDVERVMEGLKQRFSLPSGFCCCMLRCLHAFMWRFSFCKVLLTVHPACRQDLLQGPILPTYGAVVLAAAFYFPDMLPSISLQPVVYFLPVHCLLMPTILPPALTYCSTLHHLFYFGFLFLLSLIRAILPSNAFKPWSGIAGLYACFLLTVSPVPRGWSGW